MGAKTARPNREPTVVDVEGGVISARDIKVAREVVESAMDDRDFLRLANRIIDEARDSDTSLTRATRDRDRATPRDVSHVDSPRLRTQPPATSQFRRPLTGRQRKIRSATKNRVLDTAPASQRKAARDMLVQEDPAQWRRINGALHYAAGDVHQLDEKDRAQVQRLDRLIQSYERENDRTHTVYVSVKLPDTHPSVRGPLDLPSTLQPGAKVAFDQFTIARHSMHETHGHDSDRHVVLEVTTSRGMYFGHSDTVEDTTHILPRGMNLRVHTVGQALYHIDGGHGTRLVAQLSEETS
ncbi:hypothetical protein ACNUDN_30095 [Mycobacterium sp. smrl_JER01]|uniref:hypothetical protein n=1 Tax=Mycobacterium sp. smrl_JER01 TaxID=3402633 RepID=UPI003AC9BF6A